MKYIIVPFIKAIFVLCIYLIIYPAWYFLSFCVSLFLALWYFKRPDFSGLKEISNRDFYEYEAKCPNRNILIFYIYKTPLDYLFDKKIEEIVKDPLE